MLEAREIEKCIDVFGTDLYRFCRKLCAEPADAEDLYQQTFLKSLESDWTLDWSNNPRALFFSLAHNLWKSDVRKSARRAAIAPCRILDGEGSLQVKSSENIEEAFAQKELISKTNALIENLPDKIRVPLTLFYLFDFSIEQIAQTIKKPAGTVKSRLFKGRSLLKKGLEEIGYGKQEL